MHRSTLLIFAALTASTAQVYAQGLLQTITTPEKAVATVNQTLEGTWLLELRRPGQPATVPPTLNLITFQPDGTAQWAKRRVQRHRRGSRFADGVRKSSPRPHG